MAGNTLHAGIGSDLDGAFGREQRPCDLDTIADLAKLSAMLTRRDYSAGDIGNQLCNNWLRFLRKVW